MNDLNDAFLSSIKKFQKDEELLNKVNKDEYNRFLKKNSTKSNNPSYEDWQSLSRNSNQITYGSDFEKASPFCKKEEKSQKISIGNEKDIERGSVYTSRTSQNLNNVSSSVYRPVKVVLVGESGIKT